MDKKCRNFILVILCIVSIVMTGYTDAPFWWATSLILSFYILNLAYKYNHPHKKENLIDLATGATIVLTIVLISISMPILLPRVEVISIGQPSHFFVTDTGTGAYRIFDFKVIKPLVSFLPTFKTVHLGNKIYDVRTNDLIYGTTSSIVHWYPSGERNSLIFENNPSSKGYESEIVSLEIATDFYFNVYEFGTNITNFYELENYSGIFCSRPLSISNYQNNSFIYNKNLTLYLNSSTVIAIWNKDLGYYSRVEKLLNYMDSNPKKGCFYLGDSCGTLNIPESYRNLSEQRLSITFSNMGQINPFTEGYYVTYFPDCQH